MAAMTGIITCALLVTLFPLTLGSRILLHATQQVSHVQELCQAGGALVGRGHQVYVLVDSAYPKVDPITQAGIVPIFYEEPAGAETFLTYYSKQGETVVTKSISGEIPVIIDLLGGVCERMLDNKKLMQELIGLKFDLVIVDGFVLQMCNFALPHVLGVPHVYMFSGIVDLAVGIPALPSFAPTTFGILSDRMTFMEKLTNIGHCMIYAKAISQADDKARFGKYTDGLSMLDIMAKSELFIVTRDYILEWPLPTLPNVMRLPGLTIRDAKELPQDVKVIVDQSEVIVVVSFGSSVDTLPDDIMTKFLKAFDAVKDATFMFRVSSKAAEKLKEVPKHVKLLPWLPQQDLIGQSKTKVFITHCGNNGQYEAVYHGVPMIGFPLFAEQPHNCMRMKSKGLGLCMDINSFTSDDLSNNINMIMNDVDYSRKAKRLSAILRAQGDPNEAIADQLEHVMEFGGDHLRSVSAEMPLYEFLMLDILGFVLLILLLSIVVIWVALSWLCQYLGVTKCGSKSKTE